ncbi:MAG TPA: glycosyltransferase family 39 protein [Vicinamibacterales bacterium]|nr:glycosyltransferase family 39 protein [Vicinamibacterales bacterium]
MSRDRPASMRPAGRAVEAREPRRAGAAAHPVSTRRVAARAAAIAALLERHGVIGFAGLTVAYWGITVAMARHKPLWNDELYTYYIAILPTMRDVWAALMARGEQMPPLFYVPTRLVLGAFGFGHVAMRLPEMIGFWVMSACLFAAVRRHTGGSAALCAAALPLVTTAYFFAFEARPYALVLGAAAVAYLCWQEVTLGRRRTPALVGCCLALATAVSLHYYAVLLLLPFALGEAVRTIERRRIDVAIWIALALSLVPLAFMLPLIRAGADYAGAFWSPPQWLNVPAFYEELLAPALIPVLAVLLLGMAVSAFGRAREATASSAPFPLPLHEIAAALGFLLLPLVAVALAKVATGAFVNRYVISTVIGLSLLTGAGVAAGFRRHPNARVVAAACLMGWFVLASARERLEPTGYSIPISAATIERPVEWVGAVPDRTLPVVIADPHTFTVVWHYGETIRPRLVYLADPDLALKHLGHNSVERGMLDLVKPWFGMRVEPFERFIAEHDRFLVYGDFVRRAFLNWLLPELHARGLRTELLNRAGDNMLLLVTAPGEAPSAALAP